MTGRVFIVVIAFLFSACATTPSSTPQFPKVKMEGNRLVDSDYGYSIKIPDGWKMIDESDCEKLPPDSRKQANQEFNRLIASGLRAFFMETSERAGVSIMAGGPASQKKEDLIKVWRQGRQDLMKAQNNRLGFEHVYNLEFNKFRELADVSASHQTSDGRRVFSYLQVYSFRQSLYWIELSLSAALSDFDSYLPLFYDCVNSLSVAGVSVTPQDRKSGKTVNERLEELKQLKDKSLITNEEYEKKKKQILDEL